MTIRNLGGNLLSGIFSPKPKPPMSINTSNQNLPGSYTPGQGGTVYG